MTILEFQSGISRVPLWTGLAGVSPRKGWKRHCTMCTDTVKSQPCRNQQAKLPLTAPKLEHHPASILQRFITWVIFYWFFFFLPKLIDDLSTPNCKFPDQNYSCLSGKSYRILARGNSLRETPVSGFTLLHETQPKIVPQFFSPLFALNALKY